MSDIKIGLIVQLDPEKTDQMFAGCFMIVTNIAPWGVIGYIQVPGQVSGPRTTCQYLYRAEHGTFAYVGIAKWTDGRSIEEDEEDLDES